MKFNSKYQSFIIIVLLWSMCSCQSINDEIYGKQDYANEFEIKKSQFKPDDDIDKKLDISFNVITQKDEVIIADYELYFPLSIENTESDYLLYPWGVLEDGTSEYSNNLTLEISHKYDYLLRKDKKHILFLDICMWIEEMGKGSSKPNAVKVITSPLNEILNEGKLNEIADSTVINIEKHKERDNLKYKYCFRCSFHHQDSMIYVKKEKFDIDKQQFKYYDITEKGTLLDTIIIQREQD